MHVIPRIHLVLCRTACFTPISLHEELSLLVSLYETLVLAHIPYPDAEYSNRIVENVYDDITLVYGILGQYEAPASLSTTATSQYELLLEALLRATSKTFRSRSIMRRIGWTASLAEAIEEAMMGYKMYLEKDKKDKVGEWWKRGPAALNGETGDDVLGVMIATSRLCLESLQVSFSPWLLYYIRLHNRVDAIGTDLCREGGGMVQVWKCQIGGRFLGPGLLLSRHQLCAIEFGE